MDSTGKYKKKSGALKGQVMEPHDRSGFVWTVQMVERIQLCCFISVFPGAAGKISVDFSLLLSKMECMPT